MKKKSLIQEVKHFQKIAGILKETWHPDDPAGLDVGDSPEEDPDDFDDISEEETASMPQGIALQFVTDTGDIDELKGSAEDNAKKIANYFKTQQHKDIKVVKLAEDLFKVSTPALDVFVMGPSAPNAGEVYNLYKAEDWDTAFDMVTGDGGDNDEYANVPNTVEGWVDYLYNRANPKQKAKLANIYREQMKNEEVEDARDFFLDLIDSSDPEAIVPLEDLGQYSGY